MSGQLSEADRLIVEAATGRRQLSRDELRRVLAHVAQAGFDPAAHEGVRARLAGLVWAGKVLRGADRLPSAETHYLWHVVKRKEWPTGTSLDEYLHSIETVVLDPTAGAFTSRYQGALQLGIVRRSADIRGPRGFKWVLVEYRLATGHWVTAYQIERGLQELRHPRRGDLRWLRRPR